MADQKRIKNALISVFDKNGLDAIVKRLDELDVTIYSTGGTQKFIEELLHPLNIVYTYIKFRFFKVLII